MNSFFDDSSKVKKLILLILICGISLGLIIIGVTAIRDHNAKKRQENNIFSSIADDINDIYYSNDYYRTDANDKVVDRTNSYTKQFGNAFGDALRARKFRPWYFAGGLVIFLSVGGATTLFVLYKVNENKKKK